MARKQTRRKTYKRRASTYGRRKPMARRYGYRAKRYYGSRGGMGAFKPILSGIIAGVGGGFASGFLGKWAQPAVNAGVGWFFKDRTLMTLAGYQLGSMFTNGNNAGGGSAFWEG